MYEDNEKRINWLDILKKLVKVIVVILVILALVGLISRCTKNTKKNTKTIEPEPVSLKSELNSMQEATIKYLSKDTLPTDVGSTKTIKLKYLINKGLIETVKDATGTKCDENSSYSEITRLTNNYALKTSLTCGKNTDTKTVYIGCFASCNDGICVGNETDKGVCTVTQKEDKKENVNNSVNNSNNNQSNVTTLPSNNTTKTETSTPATTPAPTPAPAPVITTPVVEDETVETPVEENKTVESVKESSDTTEQKKTKIYEYVKDVSYKYCTKGELTSDGYCTYKETETLVTTPIEKTNTTYKTTTKTETVKTKDTTTIKNSSTITYKYVGFENGYYVYTKTTKVSTPVNSTVYTCKDETYTYDSNTKKCTKSAVITKKAAPIVVEKYDYKWSEKESLGSGYTKTGKFKLQ